MNARIDVSDVIINTERMVLRPWRMSDAEDFFEYASVDGLGQMAGWLPHKSIDESKAIINMFISGKRALALEHNGKVIGSISIDEYDEEEFPEFNEVMGGEIGYQLSKDYWGRGLMPEAVNAIIKYLFETVQVSFILCCHFNENEQSKRVQEKCGFTHYRQLKLETRSGLIKDSWASLLKR